MRYYSKLRPVGPGTIPAGIAVKGFWNFDDRQFCQEIDGEAWGWFETEDQIPESTLEAYELDPEGIRTWYGVTSSVYDDGRILARITSTTRCLKKPETSFKHLTRKDIYMDWFESRKKAEEFIQESKSA